MIAGLDSQSDHFVKCVLSFLWFVLLSKHLEVKSKVFLRVRSPLEKHFEVSVHLLHECRASHEFPVEWAAFAEILEYISKLLVHDFFDLRADFLSCVSLASNQ